MLEQSLFLKFLFILCGAIFSQQWLLALEYSYEHRIFYRPLASYAMGGTGVVSHQGSEFMSMNPANLRYLKLDFGWYFTYSGFQQHRSRNLNDLYLDLDNALSISDKTKQKTRTLEVLDQYTGRKQIYRDNFKYLSLARRLDIENRSNFFRGTSVGIVPVFMTDDFTEVKEAEVINVRVAEYGVLFAFAKDLDHIPLTLGVAIKLNSNYSRTIRISFDEIIAQSDPVVESYELGHSKSIDFGAIHRFYENEKSFFDMGIAINDFLSLSPKSYSHQIVNLGSNYSFNILRLDSSVFASGL